MKKNLATVIILVFCLLNLAMNILIVFTLVPANQKINTLIAQIASAIELDLTDDVASGYSSSNTTSVSLADAYIYTVTDSLTINLATSADGSSGHVAVLTVVVNENTESEQFATYGGENTATYEPNIKSTINSTVGSFTYEQVTSDKQAVKDACTEALNALFQSSDLIISVDFSEEIYQ